MKNFINNLRAIAAVLGFLLIIFGALLGFSEPTGSEFSILFNILGFIICGGVGFLLCKWSKCFTVNKR